MLKYPPKYPPAIAMTASFTILFFDLSGPSGTATNQAALSWLIVTIGTEGYFTSPSFPPTVISTVPLPTATRAALSYSPLEPLKLLPFIPLQIHESLSLQTVLESSPIYSSTPRALGCIQAGRLCLFFLELAPSQLERHPWSLPTCVAAPRGL
jgi:hypothetical protein